MNELRILTLKIRAELDVVACRQRARQIAVFCGFAAQDQTRISTAVSELARNVYNYASAGTVTFYVEGEASQALCIRIDGDGPEIPNLDQTLSGSYQPATGMGLGILGARKLMDEVDISRGPNDGTRFVLKKNLPREAPLLTSGQVGDIEARLVQLPGNVMLSELQQQNQELIEALAQLKSQQDELLQLTRELEDTNRGVVALYAELDIKAVHLGSANAMKSRFLNHVSHEFRTPLSSIRAISRLLLDRTDGDLSAEQEKQVGFIAQCADSLSELVNDLLDLAKIEAGKVDVSPSHFEVTDLFRTLLGMLRPLLSNQQVALVVEEPPGLGRMFTDEAKVAQILRNFISNALKFTEWGEVRISAELLAEQGKIRFVVADTGIGIASEDLELVFEEFSQIPNPLQPLSKGTGLGLPLCRRLATLLGGTVGVTSVAGEGSEFWASIPVNYSPAPGTQVLPIASMAGRIPVLVVEDQQQTQLLYRSFLDASEFCVMAARSTAEADQRWAEHEPAAVVLDIMLAGDESWDWLERTKQDPARQHVPIIVATSMDAHSKAFILGAAAYLSKPLSRNDLLPALRLVTGRVH